MAIKNILVTAIKNNDNRRDCRYYFGEVDSQQFFCNAMASGEAGAKKVLSQVNIDEIIAIGSELQVPHGKSFNRESLANGVDYIQADLNAMSDFDLFRYRLMEYIKGVDMEAADIAASIPSEQQSKILDEICKKVGYRLKNLFAHLPKSKKLERDFLEALTSYSKEEQEWIKCALFHALDKRSKFASRTTNYNLPISFIPIAEVSKDDQRNMKNLHQLLSAMCQSDAEIHLYMDIHGFTPEESYIFLSFFFAMNDSKFSRIHIESINSLNDIPNGFLYRISDARKRYNIERLLSGINAFSKYGKSDMICEYWQESKINSPSIERMIYAMNSIDVGISLCNIEVLEKGIKTFCTLVNEPISQVGESEEEMFLMTLKQAIIADYGPLLKSPDGNFSYLDLIRWAFNKELYQQTITIIESRFPTFLVQNGLFYYARNEEDKKAFMADMNCSYWEDAPKDRWRYNDIEHFFMKFYGRGAANSVFDKSRTKNQIYADIRAVQVFDENKLGLLEAFSIIDNKEDLTRILEAYYDVGSLRNQINHANHEGTVVSEETCMDLPLKSMIRSSLQKVLDTFAISEKYMGKPFEIAYITPEEFMEYACSNELRTDADFNKVLGNVPCNSRPKQGHVKKSTGAIAKRTPMDTRSAENHVAEK